MKGSDVFLNLMTQGGEAFLLFGQPSFPFLSTNSLVCQPGKIAKSDPVNGGKDTLGIKNRSNLQVRYPCFYLSDQCALYIQK